MSRVRSLAWPLLCVLSLLACDDKKRSTPAASVSVAPSASAAPPVDPAKLVTQSCLSCHSREMLEQQRLTPAQWEKVVKKMVGWGAAVSADDTGPLVAFLAASYGPGAGAYQPTKISGNDALAEISPLPESPNDRGDPKRGEALYQAKCLSCHGADARGGVGVNLQDRALLYRTADVAKTLREGRGNMPPQAGITNAEVAEIVAHLRTINTAPARAP